MTQDDVDAKQHLFSLTPDLSSDYCLIEPIVLPYNFPEIKGSFDGNSRDINVHSFADGTSGIFAALGASATISKLFMQVRNAITLTGTTSFSAGILVGTNVGSITDAHACKVVVPKRQCSYRAYTSRYLQVSAELVVCKGSCSYCPYTIRQVYTAQLLRPP